VTRTNTQTPTQTITPTTPPEFDTCLEVVTSGDWPAANGVLLQSAEGDIFCYDSITSGTGAIRTMYIIVDGNYKSVVNYSLAEYDGQDFIVTYDDGTGTFRGQFANGNVNFTT